MSDDLADLGLRIHSEEVETANQRLDKFAEKATGAKRATDGLVGSTAKANTATGQMHVAVMRAVQAMAALTAGTLSAAVAMRALGLAREFSASMREVSTLVNTATFNMDALTKAAFKQAAAFNTPALEQSRALYQIISAGASTAAQAIDTLTAANKLAVGGVTDIRTAADGLTSVLNAYGSKVAGVSAVSDSMFVAVKAGKTTIEELSRSLGVAAPLAAAAGVSFDELTAATAALTKGGVTTSVAVTGLRAILAAVAKPADEASKVAKKLGLDFSAAGLEAKGFAGFMEDVVTKTHGNTEALAKLFGGVEALVPVMALAGQAGKDFNAIMGQMADKAGATDEAFRKIESGPAYQLDRLFNQLGVRATELGSAFLDKAAPAIKFFADVASGAYKPSFTLDVILKALAFTAGIVATKAFYDLAKSVAVASAAQIASSAAWTRLAGNVANFGVIGGSAVSVIQGLGVAVRFALGPVGLLITAATLLGAAWAYCAKENDAFNAENERLRSTAGGAKSALDEYAKAAADAASATGNAKKQAEEHAEAMRKEAEVAVTDAKAIREKAVAAAAAAEQEAARRFATATQDGPRSQASVTYQTGEYFLAESALKRARERLASATDGAAAAQARYQDILHPKTIMDAAQANTALNVSLEDTDKAYEKLLKSAKDYLDSLQKETAEMGLNEVQRRQLASATIIASMAADGWTREELDLAAAISAATDEWARQYSLLQSIKQLQATAKPNAGLDREFSGGFSQAPVDTAGIEAAVGAAERLAEAMGQVAAHTRDVGDGFAAAFGAQGEAIAGVMSHLTRYQATLGAISAQREHDFAEYLKVINSEKATTTERTEAAAKWGHAEDMASKEAAHARLDAYASMADAAKGFFKENTAGYKAMQVVEIGLHTLEMLHAIESMAMDATKTASSVANSGTRATAHGVEAYAKTLASLPFPFNLAAGAVVLAALAAVGVALTGGHGGGAIPGANDAKDRQAAMGTGSILGDSKAKSDSIAHSLEIVAANTNKDLEYSNSMVTSLRSIDNQIGAVTAALARQLGAGGTLDTSGLNLGTSVQGPSGFMKFATAGIAAVLPGLFGTKVTNTLQDLGVQFNPETIGSIIASGINGSTYEQVATEKKKKFFGFTYSDKTRVNTSTGALDPDFVHQTNLLIASLRDGVVAAASVLGVQGAEATLNAFTLNLGKLSFKDMSADEIQKALENVFSAAADQMAAAVIPGLSQLQKAGEGLFETLTRVAREYQVVDISLQSIGKTFNGVGVSSIAARDRLVQLMGGMDELQSATDFFAQNFLTEAQRMAPIQAAVTKELQRLGVATDISREGFASLVQGIDVSTAAGAQLFASLMAVAPALDKVLSYSESLDTRLSDADLATKRRELEIALMQAQGRTLDALNAQRADELAGMDDRLRALQQAVWAAQDQAQRISDARQVLTDSYNRESAALAATASRLRAQADALAQFRQELAIGPSAVTSAEAQYRAAKSAFNRIAGLAVAGDETAMGQLKGAGTTFLDASKAFATNAQDVLRDRAAVLRAVDAAALTATTGADVATQQLDAMKASVTGLIDLNEKTVSVHDAIVALQDALVGSTPAQAFYAPPAIAPAMPVTAAPPAANDTATRDEIKAMRDDLNAALTAIATNTSKTARELDRIEADGLKIRGDDPTLPAEVKVVNTTAEPVQVDQVA